MMSDFRETLYTVDAQGHRRWVYPAIVSGYFRKRRKLIASILICIYVFLPWISIHQKQAVLFDFVHRKFILFGATFWATDTTFLFLILISLGFSLFFFTAVFGRVWCGWACPETIFLEFVFRPIECWIEGNESARRKLDQGKKTFQYFRKKTLKYFVFVILSWVLASTFLAYFIGREPLLNMMSGYPWENWSTFLTTLFLMSLLLFQFGWFREQFCTVLCPYARFQSVLMDDASLSVGYDPSRGEPRGKLQSKTSGDCVDCKLCVRVCPTGIDIRNGLQLECIQCAACIDACNSVMERIHRPKGLIRYDTERGLAGKPSSFLRPRIFLYGVLLIAVFGTFAFSLLLRSLSEISLFHSNHDQLFTVLPHGDLSNHFELRIENKSSEPKKYLVTILKDPELHITIPENPFPVAPDSRVIVPLFISFPSSLLIGGQRKFQIEVTDGENFHQSISADLIGPG